VEARVSAPIAVSGQIAEMKAALAEARAKAAEQGQKLDELDELEKKPRGPSSPGWSPNERPPVAPGPGRASLQDGLHPGRDFSGLDLRGGANLEATILTGANLTEARLDGANLRYAVLVQADLARADV